MNDAPETMSFKQDRFKFLSNMYQHPIIYNGIRYSCSESAYQANKSNPSNLEICKMNGYEAKKYAKNIKIRDDWDGVKLQIMEDILRIKFSDNYLLQKLKDIQIDIVENNYWNDRFWGKCNGVGENNLGKILMKIRDEK